MEDFLIAQKVRLDKDSIVREIIKKIDRCNSVTEKVSEVESDGLEYDFRLLCMLEIEGTYDSDVNCYTVTYQSLYIKTIEFFHDGEPIEVENLDEISKEVEKNYFIN